MKKTILLSLLLFSNPGFAQSGIYSEISEKLIQLRQEVENLGRSQEHIQKERTEALENLLRRKSELEQQARKEKLREAQLKVKIEITKKAVTPLRVASALERKVLTSWLSGLKSWVQTSLPFQNETRMAALERIEKQLQSNESPELILNSLWQVTEKEIRLTRDNSYEVMDLKLSGGTHKSEVVRLGMMQMLYKTPDGEAGYAQLQNGKWNLVGTLDPSETVAIDRLMSKLKEQQGRGYFEVPGLRTKDTL